MEPKVSIIVPCYCQEEYLAEALDSVLVQTYHNWECVIVDDGSPDNTEKTARAYCQNDSRFKYVKQENQGLAAARNTGIAASDGEYILPLDSDDKLAPSYLEKALSHFSSYPQTKLVYCKAMLFGAENSIWQLDDYDYNKMLWKNSVFCSSMYKRVDFNRTRGYNSNMKYGFEDWDFWLSLLSKDDVVYCIDEPLFFYRVKEGSMLKSLHKNHFEEALIQIYKNHVCLYQPFMSDFQDRIVYYRTMMREKDKLEKALLASQNEVLRLKNTRAYCLGKLLLKPFSVLKRKL